METNFLAANVENEQKMFNIICILSVQLFYKWDKDILTYGEKGVHAQQVGPENADQVNIKNGFDPCWVILLACNFDWIFLIWDIAIE